MTSSNLISTPTRDRALKLLAAMEATTSEIHFRASSGSMTALALADEAAAIVSEAEAAVLRELDSRPSQVAHDLIPGWRRLRSIRRLLWRRRDVSSVSAHA